MMLRHWLTKLALAIGIVSWLLSPSADGSLRRIRESGKIRIGYAAEPPYSFPISKGQVTGESPEVAKRVVAELEIPTIDWVQTSFDALIPDLETGRIDVIAAGMFVTTERSKRVAFSLPTFHVGPGLLVRKDNPRNLHSCTDLLTQRDARVAVLSGAIEGPQLLEFGVMENQLVVVPDAAAGKAAVESGMTDGLALSGPAIRWAAAHDQSGLTDRMVPFAPPPGRQVVLAHGAFAFRKTDHELREAWNAVLGKYLGSEEHRGMVTSFGFLENELPQKTTTEEVQ